jgi:four helix bundle protein
MREFDHERMQVYRRAMEFVKLASAIRQQLPIRRTSIGDQLDRAAISIPLNVAEGAGEFARREKARFYRIARRSATECAAILDVVRELELADGHHISDAKEHLREIVAMLIGLGKWLEHEPSVPEP